mgnify:FL=1|jgi:hypothetical protein
MNYLYFIASLGLVVGAFFGMFSIADTTKEQVYFLGLYTVGFCFICHFGSHIIDDEQRLY